MMASTGEIIAYAIAPTAATVVGAAIAAFYAPGPRLRSSVQHIAAGVVFAAVAGELLPQVLDIHKPVQIVLGFGAGIVLMLGLRTLLEPQDASGAAADPRGLVAIVGVDLLIDGLIVGVGFAAGTETGVLLVIAMTLEVLFLGLSTGAELGQATWGRGRIIGVSAGLAALLIIGAAIGAFTLRGLSDAWLEVVLGFGVAALLYLVTEELLVEAHEVPETPLTTALFFGGFLALLLVEMAA